MPIYLKRKGASPRRCCAAQHELLSIAPLAKQNEDHHEDIEARHWRRRSSHNPGVGGKRALAFLADAPRARAAGR